MKINIFLNQMDKTAPRKFPEGLLLVLAYIML